MSIPTPRKRQTVEQAGYLGEPPLRPHNIADEPTRALPMVKPNPNRAKPSRLVDRTGQVLGIALVIIVMAFILAALGIVAVKLLLGLWGAL